MLLNPKDSGKLVLDFQCCYLCDGLGYVESYAERYWTPRKMLLLFGLEQFFTFVLSPFSEKIFTFLLEVLPFLIQTISYAFPLLSGKRLLSDVSTFV